MKKTQKRLGNKGFSLVELIVVIAIMAVLVGVLAPTLIRNVEKSRKSKDDQNLDAIKEAIQVTLQEDGPYAQVVVSGSTTPVVEINGTTGTVKVVNPFKDEFEKNLDVTKTKLTSKEYKDKTYEFVVDGNGTVSYKEKTVTPTPSNPT